MSEHEECETEFVDSEFNDSEFDDSEFGEADFGEAELNDEDWAALEEEFGAAGPEMVEELSLIHI